MCLAWTEEHRQADDRAPRSVRGCLGEGTHGCADRDLVEHGVAGAITGFNRWGYSPREATLRRNTLRKVAFLHTVPPRWQPPSN